MDLILRNARVLGSEGAATDIGIDKGRIAAIAAQARRERARPRPRRPARVARLRRDPHPPRQVVHPRPLQGREGRPRRGDRRGRRAEEDVHRRRTSTPAPSARSRKAILNGTTHMRTHLEVDPGIGLRGLEGVLPADRRVQVGDRPRDLRLPAGGPAQQSRHRRADGRGAEDAAARWSAPRPTPTATRTARSTASSRSRASSTSTSTCTSISAPTPDDLDLDLRLRADRALQVRRPRRDRPRHQARRRRRPSCSPSRAKRMADAGVAAHRAALDRPLPDGPRT